MIGNDCLAVRSKRIRKSERRYRAVGTFTPYIQSREQAIMAGIKPKREKREETAEEFVKRINKQAGRTNGLKKQLKGARR
jgi:hypothetical protein|tara:strand:+ start:698 stop:937 length:240 start_codon:yes stop_codon:yes gene_type:complete